ncbi:MAG: FliA/WhiG family RNA polymerase sigma factor [Actinobacteria bacterium]|nr:FliA/WhiG family RNA polymerase sigma factor [Actinomycetota bacterium]MCL5447072.1 FliA/WhiG family RNA polymerase sigma factor [Actinomycetota bacterium]
MQMVDGARVPDSSSIHDTWLQYKTRGGRELRNKLILYYSPVVKYVAGRIGSGLPDYIEQSDLVSYGFFGLMDAIERFEPSRGPKFESYAISRIRGAIIDELRKTDWVPRSVRNKAKEVEHAYGRLHTVLGRVPSESEVADDMGITGEALQDILKEISVTGLVAIEQVFFTGNDHERKSIGDMLASSADLPPLVLESKEARELLNKALRQLRERERTVIVLYYYEGLTLSAIGDILGVTESRVCQIHTKAVLQLRSLLSASS